MKTSNTAFGIHTKGGVFIFTLTAQMCDFAACGSLFRDDII